MLAGQRSKSIKSNDYLLKLEFDLTDLEEKGRHLVEVIDDKVDELDQMTGQLDVQDYMAQLGEQFDEVIFDPLDPIWEEEFDRLFEDED